MWHEQIPLHVRVICASMFDGWDHDSSLEHAVRLHGAGSAFARSLKVLPTRYTSPGNPIRHRRRQ